MKSLLNPFQDKAMRIRSKTNGCWLLAVNQQFVLGIFCVNYFESDQKNSLFESRGELAEKVWRKKQLSVYSDKKCSTVMACRMARETC